MSQDPSNQFDSDIDVARRLSCLTVLPASGFCFPSCRFTASPWALSSPMLEISIDFERWGFMEYP